MSLTLDDLSGKTTPAPKPTNLKPVSIGDMGLKTEEPEINKDEPTGSFVTDAFNALDNLIDRTKQEYNEKPDEPGVNEAEVDEALQDFDPEANDGPLVPLPDSAYSKDAIKLAPAPSEEDMTIESNLHKEIEEDTDSVKQEPTKEEKEAETEKAVNDIFSDDSDDASLSNEEFLKELDEISASDDEPADADEDEEEELPEERRKELLEKYKKQVNSALKHDYAEQTKNFSVSKKSISISSLFNVKEPDKRIADWVQPTLKKAFSTVEYGGIEMQKLNPNTRRNRNSINTIKDIYRTIYNHLVGASKDGFENWLRSTPYKDVQHFYFGAYKATFGDVNIVTYQCDNPKCQNVFVEEKPIDSMYEFKNDEAQTEFNKIYNGDTTPIEDFEEYIMPVSDQFAVGLIEPSIYGVEIEPLMIDEEMQKKYSRITNFLPFIRRLYYIDKKNKEYCPIDERAVPRDIAKTIKMRLAIYYQILGALSNDQLSVLQVYVYQYRQKEDPIKFIYPECNCPECGKLIAKREATPQEMLFSRAQSPLVANLSEN